MQLLSLWESSDAVEIVKQITASKKLAPTFKRTLQTQKTWTTKNRQTDQPINQFC